MTEPFSLTRRSVMLAPLFLAACRNPVDVIELSGSTMGTSYSVAVVNRGGTWKRDELQQAIDLALGSVNSEMSNWDSQSEISRLNATTSTSFISVSEGLAQVVAAADRVKTASGGQFDLSLGPLIELWGFGATSTPGAVPGDSAIADALAATGRIEVSASGTLRKTNPNAEIYVSALGKGHGVDRLAGALRAMGVTDFFAEIGGDLVTSGNNPDGLPWQIGIETPFAFDRSVHEVVGVSGFGVATSGDYRNYFEQDGQRFSHILDARTGRPVTHGTASATVLAEDAMMADAWSTAMLVLGRDRGLEVAEENNVAVMFIDHDGGATGFVSTRSPRFDAIANGIGA